jgi:hypothetical protein
MNEGVQEINGAGDLGGCSPLVSICFLPSRAAVLAHGTIVSLVLHCYFLSATHLGSYCRCPADSHLQS